MNGETNNDSQAMAETSQMPYSVKIEQTAKGARVSVHVYAKTLDEAASQAVELLKATESKLAAEGVKIAPVEVK